MTPPNVCYQVYFDGFAEARVYESSKDAVMRILEKMMEDGGAWRHDEDASKDGVECYWERVEVDGDDDDYKYDSMHISAVKFKPSSGNC